MHLNRQTLPGLGRFALQALDRPARTALDLSVRPMLFTAPPALVGLGLVALACAFGDALVPASLIPGVRLDLLRAALEALIVVTPSGVVVATLLGVRASPGMLLSTTSLALFTAGVVAACLSPLTALLAVVSSSAPAVTLVPVLLLPAVVLGVLGAVPVRVLDSVDGTPVARGFGRAQALVLFAVFLARAHSLSVVVGHMRGVQ